MFNHRPRPKAVALPTHSGHDTSVAVLGSLQKSPPKHTASKNLKNNGSVSRLGGYGWLWMAMVYPSGHLDRKKHEAAGYADVGTVGISGF